MAVAPLADFTVYGPTHIELLTVEKALDQGLDALKVDEVNFAELAGSFERSTKIQEAILSNRQDALATLPEDETLLRVRNISASLSYLDSNFAVINTMLRFLVTHGSERLTDDETQLASSTDITQQASNVLERFTDPSMKCNKAMLAGQKLLKTVDALRRDALYPRFLGGLENVTQVDALLGKTAHEAAEWGQKALRVVSSSFDSDGKFHVLELDLDNLLRFYWSTEFDQIDLTVARLNGWIEEASVLMNSSEIERGPTPWSQKAKELEAARKKNSEAAVLLENLKAEHKATLLSLHERERVIETRSLEIEHLEAKYRDATNKVADAQQLRDRIVQADQEVIELQKQLRTQQLKIESLEEHVTRSDRSDHAPLVPDASNLATEPVEQPMTSRTLPAQLNSLLSALQTENHWLRQREHADMFDRNLRHMFTRMRPTRQRERVHPGELELWDEWLSDEDEDDVSYVSPSRFPSTHAKDAPEPSSPQRKESRPKMWPLALRPAQTGWQASMESAAGAWAGFELSLDKDLSMLGGNFDEDDALDYEDLNELQV
jgi:dynactin 1